MHNKVWAMSVIGLFALSVGMASGFLASLAGDRPARAIPIGVSSFAATVVFAVFIVDKLTKIFKE